MREKRMFSEAVQGEVTVDTSHDAEIMELVETIRGYRARVVALEAKIDTAREVLADLLQQRGKNWSDDEGYARLTSDGVRVMYKTKALDDLIREEPFSYDWLNEYR